MTPKNPTRIVNLRWDDDLLKLVDAAAQGSGQTRTKWVEQAVRLAAGMPEVEPLGPTEKGKKSAAPSGYIHEKDCPHYWSAYRRPKEGLYCTQCRKFVIESDPT